MLRRKKLSQRIYKVAVLFGSVARQLRMQSRNMERQAQRKFGRVKEFLKKGHVDRARQEAAKVVTFRKRALELDSFAEDLTDISATLMGLAPFADTRKALEKAVKVVGKLSDMVNLPAVGELFGELRTLMSELGMTMEALGEPGGVADVTTEAVPEEEISKVVEKASIEIGSEIPTPELEGLEERLRKLREKGEGK